MAEKLPPSANDRIDQALARIETALANRALDHRQLAARHATLRAEMSSAIAALDEILAAGVQ